MDTVFLLCALFGGTLLVVQFGMTALGIGIDAGDLGDAGGDLDLAGPDGTDTGMTLFKMISLQTIVAAIAFFGIAGLAGRASGLDLAPTLGAAVVAGLASMYMVYHLGRLLHRFNSDGTVRIEQAIGQAGTVYIPIPGENAGTGKIQITVQSRIEEFSATTVGPRLATGTKIRVTDVIGPDTVRVEKFDAEETHHDVA